VEFSIPKEERKTLAGEIYSKIVNILNTEKIVFENDVLKQYIIKYFPDFRRTINEIQYKSSSGTLSPDMSDSLDDGKFKDLIGFLKTKNFSEMRKWVANSDVDFNRLARRLYDESDKVFQKKCIGQIILHLSKYQYQSAFAVDPEINTVACLVEIMVDGIFH
jgi:replication factor C small subunit